jgi:hypothetical protein
LLERGLGGAQLAHRVLQLRRRRRDATAVDPGSFFTMAPTS